MAQGKKFFSTSSARALQSSFNSWQDGSATQQTALVAAVVAAGGAFFGVSNAAEFEGSFTKRRKTNVIDPMTFPTKDEGALDGDDGTLFATSSSPKDPMTSYAKYAIEREMKEVKDSESRAQATSPVEEKAPVIAAVEKKYINEMTAEELRIEEATRKAKQHSGGLKLFSGNGNMALSLEIARHLGINLGKATVGRFADGEANVVIHENVRGKDVYVVQPTCPPVNDNIMELLLMVSTLRRASARRITVVIPYYGYARQDRKMQVRHCFHHV